VNELPEPLTAVPATALPLASSTVTIRVVSDTPFAVTDAGLATIVDVADETGPATNVTDVVSWALPSVAVTVSVCATVDASVAVNTPLALVVPVIGVNVLPDPLADSVTAVPATALPLASSTVTVRVVSDVPFAVTDAGLATMVDVVDEAGPATNVTDVVSWALPSVAVTVSCATVDASVAVNTPLALVVPVIGATVLPEPLADSVTAVPATALPYPSSTVTVRVVSDVPFAVTDAGVAMIVDVVDEAGPATNVTDVVSWALPSVAVTVSVCATVDASMAVNTPSALLG